MELFDQRIILFVSKAKAIMITGCGLLTCITFVLFAECLAGFQLQPFDGRPMIMDLTKDATEKLSRGKPFKFQIERNSFPAPVVVADVNAEPEVCIKHIRDLKKHSELSSIIKDIDVYYEHVHENGTAKTAAQFFMSVMGTKLDYSLMMTYEPNYRTITWTLDYAKHKGYIEDHVGHWEVLSHPFKTGWSRVVYSAQLLLPQWVPRSIAQIVSSKTVDEAISVVKALAEDDSQKKKKT